MIKYIIDGLSVSPDRYVRLIAILPVKKPANAEPCFKQFLFEQRSENISCSDKTFLIRAKNFDIAQVVIRTRCGDPEINSTVAKSADIPSIMPGFAAAYRSVRDTQSNSSITVPGDDPVAGIFLWRWHKK